MGATKQLCTFSVGEGFFGIPVERVQEVVRPQPITPVPLAPKVIRGLINLRGQILTAIDLRYRLGLGEPGDAKLLMNVVVRTDDSPVSFLVDEIGEVLDVDEDSFEAPPDTLQGEMRNLIGGAYKLEGRLLLALSTERTVSPANELRNKNRD
ncbi:MAG TPA: chemotaxis protein CheW [Terriglobales bacterium]|nr:chemotaxis protein CheW [Terriglobales bacterium]